MAELPKINIITAGHVDAGKSTIIGRLLYDSGTLRDDQLRKLKDIAKELKKETFEFAFVMDKLKEERERGVTIVRAKVPVSEMFGFDSALKSATGGKGFYSLIDVIFERLPRDLQDQTIIKIRKRKGLSDQISTAE